MIDFFDLADNDLIFLNPIKWNKITKNDIKQDIKRDVNYASHGVWAYWISRLRNLFLYIQIMIETNIYKDRFVRKVFFCAVAIPI